MTFKSNTNNTTYTYKQVENNIYNVYLLLVHYMKANAWIYFGNFFSRQTLFQITILKIGLRIQCEKSYNVRYTLLYVSVFRKSCEILYKLYFCFLTKLFTQQLCAHNGLRNKFLILTTRKLKKTSLQEDVLKSFCVKNVPSTRYRAD